MNSVLAKISNHLQMTVLSGCIRSTRRAMDIMSPQLAYELQVAIRGC